MAKVNISALILFIAIGCYDSSATEMYIATGLHHEVPTVQQENIQRALFSGRGNDKPAPLHKSDFSSGYPGAAISNGQGDHNIGSDEHHDVGHHRELFRLRDHIHFFTQYAPGNENLPQKPDANDGHGKPASPQKPNATDGHPAVGASNSHSDHGRDDKWGMIGRRLRGV